MFCTIRWRFSFFFFTVLECRMLEHAEKRGWGSSVVMCMCVWLFERLYNTRYVTFNCCFLVIVEIMDILDVACI